ncbi:MAG: UvrD-helicase domain-containing protein, partial [Clostridia bacterium]|nr:UvrD-helicase domain-containing protein [Clostridia bacterium]
MNEKWTENQKKAIEASGKTLIVSASAGSGKTSVLTERIMKKLLDGKDISDFLIVTFTKAAAADMREKLHKKISASLAEKGGADMHLRKQLSSLPSAQIGTIHAFCLNAVKQNFHVLNLSPTVRTLDGTDCAVMLSETIEKEAEKELAKETPDADFLLLYNNFSSRKDPKAFPGVISSVYSALRAQPYYFDILENRLERINTAAEAVKSGSVSDCEYFASLKKSVAAEIKSICGSYRDLLSLAENCVNSEKYISALRSLCECAESAFAITDMKYEEALIKKDGLSFPQLPSVKDHDSFDVRVAIKEENKVLKERLKKALDTLFAESREQIILDLEKTSKIQSALIAFIKNVEKEYDEKKRELGGIEFSDMEQMTLKLLLKPVPQGYLATEFCKRLRNDYEEIFIDEYQDINPLQDMIFKAISTKTNRFMVGDVKQSIYRFRNAYPDIFEEYKNTAPDYPGGKDINRIFLTRNFRCSSSIIDFVNLIFERIYTIENVGSSYEKEKLIFAKNTDAASVSPRAEIFFDERAGDDDEEKNEKEALFVANEIIRLKNSFVKENGEKLKFSDVALLFSSAKGVSYIFEKVLKSKGIPVSGEKGVDLFECPEILTLNSFLKVIENTTDDIALASVMRSPLFSFTADELYKIRKDDRDCSLYDSVVSYSAMYNCRQKHVYRSGRKIALLKKKSGTKETFVSHGIFRGSRKRSGIIEELAVKCRAFVKKLNDYRVRSLSVTLHEIVWNIFEEGGLLRAACAGDDGENARDRLMFFYDTVRNFENGNNVSLSSLNTYTAHLKAVGKTFVPSKGGEDAVRLMTVHHSKGLEFPVVFLCDANKTFNTDDLKSRVLTSREFGVCFKLTDEDGLKIKDTLIRKAAASSEKRQSKNEEARKLYVALTRPKELLYVTATVNAVKKKDFASCSSLLDMIICAFDTGDYEKYVKEHKNGQQEGEIAVLAEPEQNLEKARIIDEEKLKDLDYSYPFESISALPEKISVSEIHAGLLEDGEYQRKLKKSDFSSVPEFISGVAAANEIGTSNHLFMQFADFENVE